MAKHLRWLGLRSLKEVSAGHVMIRDNTQLCYLRREQWTRLLKSSQQSVSVRNNAPPADCGEFAAVGPCCPVTWTESVTRVSPPQSGRTRPVTRSAPTRAAGVPVPPCVSPVGTSAVGGAVWPPVMCCRGENSRHFPIILRPELRSVSVLRSDSTLRIQNPATLNVNVSRVLVFTVSRLLLDV